MESNVHVFSYKPGYWMNQLLLLMCKQRSKSIIPFAKVKESETRIRDINAAISVLSAQGKEIPMEWIDELGDRVNAHNKALKA